MGGEERASSERLRGGCAASDSEGQLLFRLAQAPACDRAARRRPPGAVSSPPARRLNPRQRRAGQGNLGDISRGCAAFQRAPGDPGKRSITLCILRPGSPWGAPLEPGAEGTPGVAVPAEGVAVATAFSPNLPGSYCLITPAPCCGNRLPARLPFLFPRCNLVGFLTSRSNLVAFSLSLDGRHH